ncbi:MAG: hypothetical protein JWM44_1542 [Bacilli bacterium]|nr:hypothetical protein [Bacilli bacterium]
MPLYTCPYCGRTHINPDVWKLCVESHFNLNPLDKKAEQVKE